MSTFASKTKDVVALRKEDYVYVDDKERGTSYWGICTNDENEGNSVGVSIKKLDSLDSDSAVFINRCYITTRMHIYVKINSPANSTKDEDQRKELITFSTAEGELGIQKSIKDAGLLETVGTSPDFELQNEHGLPLRINELKPMDTIIVYIMPNSINTSSSSSATSTSSSSNFLKTSSSSSACSTGSTSNTTDLPDINSNVEWKMKDSEVPLASLSPSTSAVHENSGGDELPLAQEAVFMGLDDDSNSSNSSNSISTNWNCSACTMSNPASVFFCTICDTQKPFKSAQTSKQNHFDHHYSQQQQQSSNTAKIENLGMMKHILTKYKEFERGNNEELKSRICQMADVYGAWRSIRGDGNCYYRSIIVSLFSKIFDSKHYYETETQQLLKRIYTTIQNAELPSSADNDARNRVLDYLNELQDIAGGKILVDEHGNVKEGKHEHSSGKTNDNKSLVDNPRRARRRLLNTLRTDDNIDQMFIRTFRMVTSSYVQSHSTMELPNGMTYDQYYPLDAASSLKQWCEEKIEAMGEDAEGMVHPSISRAFGISVKIIFLSREQGASLRENCFSADNKQHDPQTETTCTVLGKSFSFHLLYSNICIYIYIFNHFLEPSHFFNRCFWTL